MRTVLSIDQASNNAGWSVWQGEKLLASGVLKSQSPLASFSKRLQYMVPQLTAALAPLPVITDILFESVQARLVTVTVGAFLTCPLLDVKLNERTTFITSSTWKKWAQRRGATGPFKDIKGVKALLESGWRGAVPQSDDEADSYLMYLAWKEQHANRSRFSKTL